MLLLPNSNRKRCCVDFSNVTFNIQKIIMGKIRDMLSNKIYLDVKKKVIIPENEQKHL